MDVKRSYRRRGTPDLPVATYIGIAGKNMHKYSEPHYHPETEIMLQQTGTTTMKVNGSTITYQPGDIMIIPPNAVHLRMGFSADSKIYRMVFSPEAIRMGPEHFFQKGFVAPLSEGRLEMPTLLQPGHPAYPGVYAQMQQLESCRIYEKNYKQNRLSVLMSICLVLMPHCRVITYGHPLDDPGHEAVKLCMRYLHNNHTQRLALSAIAEHCHLHPNYLCSVFKQYTGESVMSCLNRIRIESAAALLRREDLPMNIVAELVGFHSECMFYRKFKEVMGVTPKVYQEQNAAKTKDT